MLKIPKLYGLSLNNGFRKCQYKKKYINYSKNEAKKISNSLHLRYPCGMLTLLKLLFTRIETRKLRTFFENSDNCTISKQNLLLNNLFGT